MRKKKPGLNRGKFEIIADTLNVCREPSGPTAIMYRVNLSYDQLNYYISYTLQAKLLEELEKIENTKQQRYMYRTTERGMEYLRTHDRLITLVQQEDLEVEAWLKE